MEYLSEDTIKRATLAFMKTYYKFRPRNGETLIHYDIAHPSGVIVDGHLTFPKEDGTPFIATFEATSASTAVEVLFRLQNQRLLWDAISFGTVFTLAFLFYAWSTNIWSVSEMGWAFSLLFTLVSFILSVLAYQILCQSAGRYRYIYAIEQFKQYHADEQWIALGNDVFPEPTDLMFTELKLQCVKNGFGLLTVDKDECINLLITPARDEVFGKKRKTLKFDETPFTQTGLATMTKPNIERFARSFFKQIATTIAGFLLLCAIFFRSWQQRPVIVLSDPAVYRDSMNQIALNMEHKSEVDKYLFKAEDAIKPNPKTKPYDAATISNGMNQDTNIGLYVFSVQDGYLSYDCERIDMQGTKYVVQDLTFKRFNDAKRRIEHLKTLGLIANAISLGCTDSATSEHDYCVYYEVIFSTEKAANTKGIEIIKTLKKLKLKDDFIKIRTLNFHNL